MEGNQQSHEPWPLRLPVVGQMGKQALGLFNSRQAFEAVSHKLDDDLATEERAIEALHTSVAPDMEGFQWKTIALIKARRLLRHMELGEEDVPVRLDELNQIFRQFPEHCSLEGLPLEFDDMETLRIKFKEIEPESE